MGVPLDIFRLYRVPEAGGAGHLLVKARRHEFPNWSQPAEDEAVEAVERRFGEIIVRETGPAANPAPALIASWEGGYPAGDCCYTSASGPELDIWFALDTVHRGYFVFGVAADEAGFWTSVEGLSRDGEIGDVAEYARPAQLVRVRFVQ
ncbi:MAG TPA: hypothetical protein VEA69_11055 [Tepidisphaeraceae bacterium]|nr:hypothetical protein [Tepidisphaeraceae bacterium]